MRKQIGGRFKKLIWLELITVMNLDEFKELIDIAHNHAGESAKFCNIEIAFKNCEYEIEGIYQMGFIGHVYLHIGKKTYDGNGQNE